MVTHSSPAHKHRRQGLAIKLAMLECGLVQREVAARLGMVLSSFNMKLRDERPFTDAEKQNLAEILKKPVDTLFPVENNPNTLSKKAEQS